MQIRALAFLLLAAPATSGCVAAAVAVPFVAGGAMATSDRINERRAAPAQSSAPIANVSPTGETNPAAPRSDTLRISSIEPSTVLPAPTSEPTSRSGFLAPMVSYATSSLEGDDPALSAVLSNPSSLDGKRVACKGDAPAILIDLDPDDDAFSGVGDLESWPEIAGDLAAIRRQDITIAWISSNSAANADIVRDALTKSGLDPAGEDQLLLMRYPADRKQTRRAELAAESCLIAIVGQERADFDELYRYLKNPDAALRLEQLIGDGWFLLSQQSSRIGPLRRQSPPTATPMEEQEQ